MIRPVLLSTALASAVAVVVYMVLRAKFPASPLESIKIVSKFGPRGDVVSGGRTVPAHFHAGVDLRAAVGTPFFAVADGRVESVTRNGPGVGLILALRLSSSPALGVLAGARVKYVHIEDAFLSVGDDVLAGQLLGTTGDADGTLDPHLHLEVKLAGAAGSEDPATFL